MFEARQRVITQARAWKPGLGASDGSVAPSPAPRPKKAVEIEALLRWTYREELPKDRDCGAARFTPAGIGHAWNSVTEYAQLMTRVDDDSFNRWGVVPDHGASGDPHPDALVVANAVLDLEGLILDLPEGWSPLSDLGEMSGHGPRVVAEAIERLTVVGADGFRRQKLDLGGLVFRHAILGGCPVWEADVPEIKTVTGANGKPRWFIQRDVMVSSADGGAVVVAREYDGWSNSAHRPLHGAYQKTYLDPDPVDAVVARAHYEIWRAALDILRDDLHGAMRDHVALPSPRSARPWESEAVPGGAILRDLTEPPPPKKPRRRSKALGTRK